MKYYLFGLVLLICLTDQLEAKCINQNKIHKENWLLIDEDFDEFIESFSVSKEFQISRIVFPFPDCNYPGNKTSHCDTINKTEWRHLMLVDTLKSPILITKTYDNFNLEMKNSGERVLSFSAVETNICSLYFFKRINAKWFLIKRLVCED